MLGGRPAGLKARIWLDAFFNDQRSPQVLARVGRFRNCTRTQTRAHARTHTLRHACVHEHACNHGRRLQRCARAPAYTQGTYMRARHTRQAIAKAVEGANRIYLTAHGHIAIVGQAALRSRAPARVLIVMSIITFA